MARKPTEKDNTVICYEKIAALCERPVALMEVCGTHTMAIGRFGIRARLPETLRLVSGPGCPVCVTPCETVDRAVAMSREPGVSILTFGDLMKVPGSESTLYRERSSGRDVRVIYSPMDALEYAKTHTGRTVVLVGVGFETTSPVFAATLVRAAEERINNVYVLPAFKRIPPAMMMLARDTHFAIDGFICPGHVSAIIGSAAYRPLAEELCIPCVVTGFEAGDILEGVTMLLEQIKDGRPRVEVQYRRAVPEDGNPAALDMLQRVFRPADSHWRGISIIPDSGLVLSEEFIRFDAERRVPVQVPHGEDLPPGCACGDVLKGWKIPTDCALFGITCVPGNPVGPCMVSSEGACAAYLRYGA